MLKWAVAREDLKHSTPTPANIPAPSSTPIVNGATPKPLKSSRKKRASKKHDPSLHDLQSIPKNCAENNAKNIKSESRVPEDRNKYISTPRGRDVGGGGNVVVVVEGERGKHGVKECERGGGGGASVSKGATSEGDSIKKLESRRCGGGLRGGSSSRGRESPADSKSLLYMSLDHLPLAIVKQYERMIQEEEDRKKREEESRAKTAEDVVHRKLEMSPEKTKRKKQRSATTVVDTKALMTTLSNMKISEEKKSQNRRDDIFNMAFISGSPEDTKNRGEKPSKIVNSPTPISGVKQAKSRALPQVHKTESFKTERIPGGGDLKARKDKRKTPSPDIPKKIREKCIQTHDNLGGGRISPPKRNNRFKVTIVDTPPPTVPPSPHFPLKGILRECKSSTLPRGWRKSGDLEETPSPRKGDTSTKIYSGAQRSSSFRSSSSHDLSSAPPNVPHRSFNPHDLTDPQFLESRATFTSAADAIRCAKSFTIKRSEIRKLEKIKNQTEKLNRFLKKYYHDCLPNLPEEEESILCPEEKSLHLSALRDHWIEKQIPPNTPSPNKKDASSNLLCSSSYYSDPLLSSLPAIIKSPEHLLKQQRLHIKQKSSQNLATTPHPKTTSPTIPHPTSPLKKRSSLTSCSSSCSCTTTSSSSSGPASERCSIINLSENFLMNTHPHNDHNKEDDQLLALQKREIISRISRQHRWTPEIQQDANELQENHPERLRRRSKMDNHLEENNGAHKNSQIIPTDAACDKVELKNSPEMRHASSEDLKLKGYRPKNNKMITGEEPLAVSARKNISFEMKPLQDEDEGFMSPYPPEVYSPSGSLSSEASDQQKERLSLSSSGKGSAEDFEEERFNEYENVGQPENNYDEVEGVEVDLGEYARLTSGYSSNCSETTYGSSGVMCGAFFPRTNEFQVSKKKYLDERETSSESWYYGPPSSEGMEEGNIYEECEGIIKENYYNTPEGREPFRLSGRNSSAPLGDHVRSWRKRVKGESNDSWERGVEQF